MAGDRSPPRLAHPLDRERAVIFQISNRGRDLLETPFYFRGIGETRPYAPPNQFSDPRKQPAS